MKTVDENDLFPYFDMGQQGDENLSKWRTCRELYKPNISFLEETIQVNYV